MAEACIVCARTGGQVRAVPCCNASLCLSCLKATARAAGRLFRCPSCRDAERFLTHAKKLRVTPRLSVMPDYADDEDEIMVVERVCCARRCKSPRGVAFDATDIKATRHQDLSAWRLLTCDTCGQASMHAGCSARKVGSVWRCDACGGVDALPPPPPESEDAALPRFRRGEKVEARYRGGPRWYAGVIVGGSLQDGYVVRYVDDDQVERVPLATRIRRRAPPAPPRPPPETRRLPAPAPAAVADDDDDDATAESSRPSSPEGEAPPPSGDKDGDAPESPEPAAAPESPEPAAAPESPEPAVVARRTESLVGRRFEVTMEAPRLRRATRSTPRPVCVVVKDYEDDAFSDVVSVRFDSGRVARGVAVSDLAVEVPPAREAAGEERYCFCRRGDAGVMIACSEPTCKEWYHVDCLDLDAVPNGRWSCPRCASAAVEAFLRLHPPGTRKARASARLAATCRSLGIERFAPPSPETLRADAAADLALIDAVALGADDDAARAAADAAFACEAEEKLRAVDAALDGLAALLDGPYRGSKRAGVAQLAGASAALHLRIVREALPHRTSLADYVALVDFMARSSEEDCSKCTQALVEDLRDAGHPYFYLHHNTTMKLKDAIDSIKLKTPQSDLADAIGRAQFPDLEDDARRVAAVEYIATAMAKRVPVRGFGANKKRPREDLLEGSERAEAKKPCKCGATDHQRPTHHACPLYRGDRSV